MMWPFPPEPPPRDRRTEARLRLAIHLHELAERDDLPAPTSDERAGAVHVRWRRGGREVVVRVRAAARWVTCRRGAATVWSVPLNRHGVDALRRALAWLAGDVRHPDEWA